MTLPPIPPLPPVDPVLVPWEDRHRKIAQALRGGTALLAFAEERAVIEEQRTLIVRGAKPVLAYAPLFRQIVLTPPEFDALKRFSGELAAFVAETLLHAQRAPGSKEIKGNDVYSSAQPFRFPPGSRGRALPGADDGRDDPAAGTPPGTERFLRVLQAILETAEQQELPLARNVVEQAIARRPGPGSSAVA